MLRVGLTGGLASGKSTVAGMFGELGAAVVSADQLGRKLMQPGQPVYTAIVETFGSSVVRADGSLDRKALAELAFQHDRADALNRIVHPAVIAAEEEWMLGIVQADAQRVAMVESALIFEVERWGTAPGWTQRFDKLILVTVPDDLKIERFIARIDSLEGEKSTLNQNPRDDTREKAREIVRKDARARLAAQISDHEKAARCDYVIDNTGPLAQTRALVEAIYRDLVQAAQQK